LGLEVGIWEFGIELGFGFESWGVHARHVFERNRRCDLLRGVRVPGDDPQVEDETFVFALFVTFVTLTR
jgi:hypothetical protein